MANQAPQEEKNSFVKSVAKSQDGQFAINTIKIVFWFCVIGLSALGLQQIVEWEEARGASKPIIYALTAMEYVVLIADVVWFISRLVVNTYVELRHIFGELSN